MPLPKNQQIKLKRAISRRITAELRWARADRQAHLTGVTDFLDKPLKSLAQAKVHLKNVINSLGEEEAKRD